MSYSVGGAIVGITGTAEKCRLSMATEATTTICESVFRCVGEKHKKLNWALRLTNGKPAPAHLYEQFFESIRQVVPRLVTQDTLHLISTGITVKSIVLVLLCVSLYEAQGQSAPDALDRYRPRVDKTNVAEMYKWQWNGFIAVKYMDKKKDTLPAHLRKLDTPLLVITLLLGDQSISEEEFVKYKIPKRLDLPIMNGLKIDSVGQVNVLIRCRYADSLSYRTTLTKLVSLGVNHYELTGGAGAGMVVRGRVPLYSIQEISRDSAIISIDRPLRPFTN